jgi:hypothetical protein
LAGSTANEEIDFTSEGERVEEADITIIADVGIVVGKDGIGMLIDFGEAHGSPVEGLPSNGGRFDARVSREVTKGHEFSSTG